MSVPTETAPSFVTGIPVPLFRTRLAGFNAYRLEFVPSADGQRILMSTPTDEDDRPAIHGRGELAGVVEKIDANSGVIRAGVAKNPIGNSASRCD